MTHTSEKTVLLGMSGGLDSTYSARLLQKAGYRVVGAVLVFSENTDIEAASLAAHELGIELLILHAEERFQKEVIRRFAEDYRNGRTPNPCVVCNRYVKMAMLHEAAVAGGFSHFATGHYADVVKVGERYAIKCAADKTKDQSYMLWGLSQDMLRMLLLPLFDADKGDVRKEALASSLSAAALKESQDICFIPDGDYVSYLARYAEKTGDTALLSAFEAGDFVLPDGKILGKHGGIVRYTVGQRKHLGVALGYPAFVTAIDPLTNRVTLSGKEGIFSSSFAVQDLVFQALSPQSEGQITAEVKIRYAARPARCTVQFESGKAFVTLDTPQGSIAKGQSAVFYDNGILLFGGVISS